MLSTVNILKQEAGVVWEVLGTEGPGHAQQILTTLDLASWGGVVVVSGDGLVHEVYNGLLGRPDWSEAIGFPVGVIPAGSGNALVRSLIHWQGEPTEPDAGLMSQCVSVARASLLLAGKRWAVSPPACDTGPRPRSCNEW